MNNKIFNWFFLVTKTSGAIVHYWQTLGIVRIVTKLDDPTLEPLKQNSKPEKWNEMVRITNTNN